MKFECYSHWSQLPAGVDLLFELGGIESMFLTREWFETLYTAAFEDNQTFILACVVDKESVIALLPLVSEDNKNWNSFKHRYTAFYSLLLVQENQTETLEWLVKGLNQMPVQSLALSPVDENDRNLIILKQAMEKSGYEYHQHFFFYNWIHRTKGQSFEVYMEGRPKQLRNTLARKQRKLDREHQYSIRMFKGDEVKAGLKGYHSAYSASWKAHEQYETLLDSTAINLSSPDWTRLAVLTIDGQPAAAQLWFVVQGKASIFRLAYNQEWKHYSPGTILTAYLLRYVIDIDKVVEIDFLTGNDAYKQDWMSERRQRWRVLFVNTKKVPNPTWFSLIQNKYLSILKFLKR